MAVIADALARPPGTTNAGSHLVVLARGKWVSALNGFTRRHDGWLVSLDVIPPAGIPQREFENLPLLGVSSDGRALDGAVAISVSWSRSEHLTHIVPSVQRLSIEQTADGADAALWIDAPDGTRTVLRFRVAALPEAVDGLVRAEPRCSKARPIMNPSVSHPVQIGIEGGWVDGDLVVPPNASGLVIFAHGSGSGRHSRRNHAVAESLQRAGLATLLLDLLTPAEETIDVATAEFRFDVGLLARRVIAAVSWAERNPETSALRIGLFGASTGAAAALLTAAARPESVGAVVSRGGRPDLAGRALRAVRSPTLLIVGGADHQVIALNRLACDDLGCERHLEIIPGATHLFQERGALEEVAQLAAAWFTHHLSGWDRTSRSA